MTLQAVVLDLDETLAIVDRDRSALLADACQAVGAPAFDRDDYVAAHANHRTADSRVPIFEDLLEAYGAAGEVDPEALAEAYREAIGEHIRPVEGVEHLLDSLAAEYRLGLLTNGSVRAQRDKIDRLGWGSLFDAIVISGHLEAGKPDERAFRAILDALEVPADGAIHVGDQVESDVEGATSAGLWAVQVLYHGGPEPDVRADGYVDRASLATGLPTVLRALDS
ncbi:MAG: HAD family hydrolase [Halobacteriales archaeon]